jgi:hypothetical protein
MTQIILPDSPSSVMQLFDADKKSLIGFATTVINAVQDGNEDALKVHAVAKKNIFAMEKIIEGIKENVKTEAAKYGDKPFMYANAECHYTPTSTTYDFEACGDQELVRLQLEFEAVKAKLDQRKEWLKTMGNPENILNAETGETFTIYPPVKRSSMGIKVTLK